MIPTPPRPPRLVALASELEALDERIRIAREKMGQAQTELEAALGQLDLVDRAEKRMISEALLAAFEKVSSAREALDLIEAPLEPPRDEAKPTEP